MRRVAFVPADAKARAENPGAVMRIHTAPSPYRGNAHGQRPLTVPEAGKAAAAKGWVRLSELPEGEQRRWRDAFRKSKGAKC